MPVLEATDEITPRSAVRHRPIGDGAIPTGKRAPTVPGTTPIAQRASRPRPTPLDTADDIAEWQHSDRNGSPQSARASSSYAKGVLTKKGSRRQAHPLLYLGIGMLTMLLLWTVLSTATGWLTTKLDDIRYGYPRTFQTDAWVGHGQTGRPSHFIALNLNRQIEIIEMPGGDAANARIYVGPQLFGNGDELVPVTLSFVDVNNDRKPDMLVNLQSSRVVFINDKESFRPAQPSERRQIEQVLQHIGK